LNSPDIQTNFEKIENKHYTLIYSLNSFESLQPNCINKCGLTKKKQKICTHVLLHNKI